MSIRIITAIAGLMFAAAPAQAVITSLVLTGGSAKPAPNNGTGVIVAQPATFAPTINNIVGFNELQNVVIGTGSQAPQGSLFDSTGLNLTTVSDVVSALPVSSHFFYMTTLANRVFVGQITFNQNVIAIQRGSGLWTDVRSAQLHNGGSDFTTLGLFPSTENTDTIRLVNPKTISYNIFVSPNNTDAFRVLTAVPEPATWMMMLTGFGLIGFARRRRNVAVAA